MQIKEIKSVPVINTEDLTDYIKEWNEYFEHLNNVFGDDK